MAKPLSIGVNCKTYRPDILKLAEDIKKYLDTKCKLYFSKGLAAKIKHKGPIIDFKNPELDIILSLGGDGTVLSTVNDLHGAKVAVLGIKRGGKGFLTEIENNAEEWLEKIVEGDYFIEERMKLAVEFNGKHIGDALNDVVVCTATPGKIQHFALEIHGDSIDALSADGIIIATPTGSTAYALSAGGPVIEPTLDAYEITPICPFRLNPRSIVVPSKSLTEVRLIKDRAGVVIIDGDKKCAMTNKDLLKATKSANKAYFIKFKRDYLKKVRKHLS